MTETFYIIGAAIVGGLTATIIFLLTRRGHRDESVLLRKIELLETAQEREERMLREEMARAREENANASKAQRELRYEARPYEEGLADAIAWFGSRGYLR